MLSRNRDGLTEAEREERIAIGAAAFGLVGDDDHFAAAAAQQLREFTIGPGEAGFRIDEEQDRVGVIERGEGLRPHARGEAAFIAVVVKPGRVDDGEAQIGDRGRRLAAVARHAG